MGELWSAGRVKVDFPAGHPQHGLWVLMRRRSVGEALAELAEGAPIYSPADIEALNGEARRDYLAADANRRLDEFAAALLDWNFAVVERNPGPDAEGGGEWVDVPVAPDRAGVARLDQATYLAIWKAYTEATTEVADPLDKPSGDGEPSQELPTLPQEPL